MVFVEIRNRAAVTDNVTLKSPLFSQNMRDAVRGGYVDEARLDEAVTNLMECRMKLGILGDERQEELDKIGTIR